MIETIKPASQIPAGCSCRSYDRFECWDLRGVNDSPFKQDGPCECECHDHDELVEELE